MGNAYYYPLARTVIGGLAASTFLTLVILPNIYVFWDSFGLWCGRVWRNSRVGSRTPALPAGGVVGGVRLNLPGKDGY